MVTFADLREARIDRLSTAAGAWEQLSAKARRIEQQVVTDLAGPLRNAGWQGAAADAALTRMTSLHDEFELYAVKTRNLTTFLHQAAAEFRRLQLNLDAAVDAATALGLHVTGDGRVLADDVPQSALSDPGALDAQRLAVQNAGIYTDLIASILADADHQDLAFADVLRRLAPDAQGVDAFSWTDATDGAVALAALAGLPASVIPAAGSSPAQIKAWWAGLSADERDLLLTAYPGQLGRLDGLPALDRDRANRMALNELIGDYLNDPSYSEDSTDPMYVRLVNLRDQLEAATYHPDQHLYLLGINNDGDGQAIVAVGNPDTARNTAILVPGVGTNLGGMRGVVARASNIQSAAQLLSQGDVSVIAWLGYDPPQMNETVVAAAGSHRAEVGAVSLDHFTDGLNASHIAGPTHLTAIGHSYGSVVVGNAASGANHLSVNDVVTAGSPGMDVNHAAQLNVGARHMWTEAAKDDPVASPGTAIPYAGTDIQRAMAAGHDIEPQQPAFGGNVMTVDTHGHSGYWAAGSQSLYNQAAVVAGRYGMTTLDYGTIP